MSREVWSQAGEPVWAIHDRLRRLEERVDQLAAMVATLTAERVLLEPVGPREAEVKAEVCHAKPNRAGGGPGDHHQ